jgi:peptidoglycan/LPS O-acetylase OafA/YrhL/lysophospholipase L1-like esterase
LYTPRGDLERLRGDALATLAYVANWRFIVEDVSYFDAFAPTSPLRHMWSLAVEEQFYLVWPLVAYFALRILRSRTALLVITLAGIVASIAVAQVLYDPARDIVRLYYGTDAKAHVILIGALLALLGPGRAWVATRARRVTVLLAGVAGAAFTAWAWTHVDGRGSFYYEGGSPLAALAVAGIIASAVSAPKIGVSRVLAIRPLRAVGLISYGLYLWHWPVFLVVNNAHTGLSGPALLTARFAATFAIATLSYFLVEMPVRRGLRTIRVGVATPLIAGFTVLVLVLAMAPPPPVGNWEFLRKVFFEQGPAGREHADPSKVRILILGDSVAWTLAFGLTARQAEHDVYVGNKVAMGCGITTLKSSGLVRFRGQPGRSLGCINVGEEWVRDVDAYQPDLVTILVGRRDVADRMYRGRFRHIGDPVLDAYIRSEFDRILRGVLDRGVNVVLLTSPYFRSQERPDGGRWPEDDPARVDLFNNLLREAAARHPGRVSVIELGKMISPGGKYSRTLDGVRVRAQDGVHFDPAGADWLAGRLLTRLEPLGRAHRDARLLTPPPTPTP